MASVNVEAFRGCLLAGALGDALGYPIEFLAGDELLRRAGAGLPGQLAYAGPGLISDDTQMTLFTAEGFIRATLRGRLRGICHPPSVIKYALLRWYETQGGERTKLAGTPGWLVAQPRLHARRAPGNTCMSALARLAADPHQEHSVDRPPNDSKGCGAVMRMAPVGLASKERAAAFRLAVETGVLTHGHPSGYLSGGYFAAVIWDVSRGAPLLDAMRHADALLVEHTGAGEMVAILARVRELAGRGAPDQATIESLGGGWVGEEALAIALLCALGHAPDEPDALARTLWTSVRHGGDSDSTGSLTGNLLGAMLGERALPAAWLAELELAEVIGQVASDLHAVAIEERELDPERYPGS